MSAQRPDVGVFLVNVVWGSKTWDANAGGIQSIDFDKGGEPLAHWSGDDILSRFQCFVRQMVDITISVDDVNADIVEGETNDLSFQVKMGDLSTVRTITVKNCKLIRLTYSQSEANAGNYRLRFVHTSLNGSSDPVSVA